MVEAAAAGQGSPVSVERTLLVQGGTLVDGRGRRRSDVLIRDGMVIGVAPDILPPGGAEVVDAGGCVVTPGFVDLQVHLREPGGEGAETIESGSRAAALGGVTAMICMPNTSPTIDDPELVLHLRSRAIEVGCCDVAPSAAITVGRSGEHLVDFEGLWAAGVSLFTDDGCAVMDADLMRRAFEGVRRLPGAYLGQHAEDASMVEGGHLHEGEVSAQLGIKGRPAAAEEVIVARDLALARSTGGRYHVLHTSSAGTVGLITRAKSFGVRVTAEVTPQHLVLTDEALLDGDSLFKMNPPLRSAAHRERLRRGLRDGTIDAIATDHAPHLAHAKRGSIEDAAPGMTGLETTYAALNTHLVMPGILGEDRLLAAMSWSPARIGGLDRMGHGGPIAPGRPANLTVVDPTTQWKVSRDRIASLSANNPFRATTLTGRVRHTLLRGTPIVSDGRLQR